jgi:hypothetical protein
MSSPTPVIYEGCPFKAGHGIARCGEIEGIVCRRSVEGKRTGDLVQNSGTRLTHGGDAGGSIPVNIDLKKTFFFIYFMHLQSFADYRNINNNKLIILIK